jgi:hypothetical protein
MAKFVTGGPQVLDGTVIPKPFDLHTGVGVLAADSQSTNASGYRASLWDPSPDFILLFFLRLTITFFFFRKRLL